MLMEKHYCYSSLKSLIVIATLCFLRWQHVSALMTTGDQIAACLTLRGVRNFTTLPSSTSTSTSASQYFTTLNFSIQNLRFADPSLPKPGAIVMPETPDQLRSAVLCSREASSRITLRSGGHSYEGTSSVAASPFVVIDLINLDRVTVDAESETAWVEAGATIGQVYLAVSKASPVHAFSAGSCPTVGAGGHISGGGFGLLSRKYGLAADNVADALLVDADGRLLDRRGMGETVFWAIRGGGGGVWGVVYAWKIKLVHVPPAVTAFVLSRPGPASHVAELVDTWQRVAPSLGDEFYLSCFVGANLPDKPENYTGLSATFKGLYLGPKAGAVSILAKVFPGLAVGKEDCTEMSWIKSVMFFSGLPLGSSISELGNRSFRDKAYFKAKSDYVRAPIAEASIRATLLSHLEKQPRGYVILDPYGGAMDRINGDTIAFPHRKGNLYSIQYMVEWPECEDTVDRRSEYMNWIRSLYSSMAGYVSSSPRAAYVNYIDFDLGTSMNGAGDAVEGARVWGNKYFLSNFDRLVRAKTRIDPLNVFSNPQGIPPMSDFVSLSSST